MVLIRSSIDCVGVDEVARGTLFGDVVSAAVIMPDNFNDDIYLQIKDSKKLSFKKRRELADYIKKTAIAYGIGCISAEEIDKINILQASIKAMHIALYDVYKKHKFNHIIVDGNHFIPLISSDENQVISYECIAKADTTYLNVAAASIIAKDYHDMELLKLIDEVKELEKYDLRNNKGYATVKHQEAIEKFGLHQLHRKTFATCKKKFL